MISSPIMPLQLNECWTIKKENFVLKNKAHSNIIQRRISLGFSIEIMGVAHIA